jgi:hypothetical protein
MVGWHIVGRIGPLGVAGHRQHTGGKTENPWSAETVLHGTSSTAILTDTKISYVQQGRKVIAKGNNNGEGWRGS